MPGTRPGMTIEWYRFEFMAAVSGRTLNARAAGASKHEIAA
jgi:hypothetical protein